MSVIARINEAALRHNLRLLSERVAPARLMFIVKANGYGHGCLDVSKIAVSQGITDLGCLEITTALEVRSVITDDSVNVLAWQFDQFDDISKVGENHIQLGVGNFVQLEQIAKIAKATGHPISVHLKLDTGLNRNGMRFSDWSRFVDFAYELETLGALKVVAVWTHIAETSDEHDDIARSDFEKARTIAEEKFGRKLTAHMAASSASFRRSEFHQDMIRNGGHVYGIPSFDGTSSREMGVIPVMTLVSSVLEVTEISEGNFEVTVSAGYLHGVPSYVAGKVEIAIAGQRFEILKVNAGTLIAVGSTRPIVGEEVYLFGDETNGEQTVREWGDAIGTLGDEICCRISPAVERRLV